MKPKFRNPTALSSAAREQLDRDLAALAAVQQSRPMRPPPMRLLPSIVTPGQMELRKARRLGMAA
jgi:hypothetical protein